MLAYPIELDQDDNGTLAVSFPDFPEAHTFGVGKAEALERAQDALVTIIDEYVRRWKPVPPPSAGRSRVAVPALTAAKLQLYGIMQREGIGKAELARRLHCYPAQVDRLFNLFHQSRLDQLERAFAAVGRQLVVTTVSQAEEEQGRPVHTKFRPVRKLSAIRRADDVKASS